MIGTSRIVAVGVCCFTLVFETTSYAGILAVHPGAFNNGMGPSGGAWRGSTPFVNGGLSGFVDWAVFASGTFNALFGGGGYVAPAGELVYAHQIFSTGPLIGVSGMDITLGGNPAGNGGSFSAGGVAGVVSVFAFADPGVASYVLATETDLLTPSEGLVYSSPNVPQLTGIPFVVDGGSSAVGVLPIGIPGATQIPEPATCFMAVMAMVVLFALRVSQK
jgi:hypothetical protein